MVQAVTRLAPLPLSTRLQNNANRKTRKEKIARGVKPNRSQEAKYNRELQSLIRAINDDIRQSLTEPLRRLEPEYVADSYAEQLNNIILNLSTRWRNITQVSKIIAAEMVNGINAENKQAFYKAMQKATGISFNGMISEEGLEPMLQAKIAENVGLIQSIPDEYFKKLVTIVNEGTTQGKPAKSMIKSIMQLGHSTSKRARLIARDQTQKVNAAVNEGRQKAMGIKEYIWRTSEDERVRETHKSKSGKRFKWSDPPEDTGHPGQDIQCRCVPEPVIDFGNNEI